MDTKLIKVALLVSAIYFTASCSSTPSPLAGKEITPFLETVKVGERQNTRVIGKLQMYDHKGLKGQGLWEIAIGERRIIIEGIRGKNFEIDLCMLNCYKYLQF